MYEDYTMSELIEKTDAQDFLNMNNLPKPRTDQTVQEYFSHLPYALVEDLGVQPSLLLQRFHLFLDQTSIAKQQSNWSIQTLTICRGFDKRGNEEQMGFTLRVGDVVSIVGPTGSGKSQLLSDIEWMAQQDTPTKRIILVDGKVPPATWRFSSDHKLVAQLTQNMNFVMDVQVGDFLALHAQSMAIAEPSELIEKIIAKANFLCGECFDADTELTALSGGQARALMVADTAYLTNAPIVLIDEIENAGIDRSKALDLLVRKNKIVLMVTHDPLLALIAHKRVVLCDGGIKAVLDTSEEELKCLSQLSSMDAVLTSYRNALRLGEHISVDPSLFNVMGAQKE